MTSKKNTSTSKLVAFALLGDNHETCKPDAKNENKSDHPHVTKNGLTKELFSSALTFMSILLGIFTFSLMYAIKWKGEAQGKPWNLLACVTGFGIFSSGVIATISFLYFTKPINPFLKKILVFLVYAMLITCGFGTPIVGWWLYYK